jgi:2'-5' RNA ligase
MRLFTAIELPEDVRELLCGWQDALIQQTDYDRGDLKWVARGNLHVTLKFLGNVDSARVPELCAALKDVADSNPPVFLWPDRLICFPKRGPVATIAAGLTGDIDALVGLHSKIERACEELVYPPERRPYTAHVTIARARPPLPAHARHHFLGTQLQRIGNKQGKPFLAAEFVLIDSHLKPDGPEYAVLARFPLRSERGTA